MYVSFKYKSGRVVASRYKSGPKNPPSRFHTGNTSAVLTAATSSSGKTHKTDKVSSIHVHVWLHRVTSRKYLNVGYAVVYVLGCT